MNYPNIDPKTVEGFGEEWAAYTQLKLDPAEQQRMFKQYFAIFPFPELPTNAEGFDLGCGSGRWAELVGSRVGFLHCIDPSERALSVARTRLAGMTNIALHHAGVDGIPLADGSQDFGYCLGVLHHVPDPAAGLRACVDKLKPGAPFLLYLYYSFDNRPAWFGKLWSISDLVRRGVSRLPFGLRKALTTAIAAGIYWPLARTAWLSGKLGLDTDAFPLSAYKESSFYTMRTDSLDRFGTRLEHRFSRSQIEELMKEAGLADVRFHESIPYVEYYLLKGGKVVGVEANPDLCRVVEQRFSAEIGEGRLALVNCALSEEPKAGPVDFFVHKQHHVLSQLGEPDAESRADFERIEVAARSPVDIIREHGEPRFIKVDLEGFDAQILRAIFGAGIRPPEISAEAHTIDVFAALVEAGYKAFNLVEGWSVAQVYREARIHTPSGQRSFSFQPHSAGPFGADVRGEWQDPDTFFYTLAAAGLGWKDIHASNLISPAPPPPFGTRMRRQATGLAKQLVRAALS